MSRRHHLPQSLPLLRPPLHLHRNDWHCDFTTFAGAPTATATFGRHRKHRYQHDRCHHRRRLGSLHYCAETQTSGLNLGRGISKGESGGVSGSETDQEDSQADNQQPDGAAVEVDDDMEGDAEVDFCCGGKRYASNNSSWAAARLSPPPAAASSVLMALALLPLSRPASLLFPTRRPPQGGHELLSGEEKKTGAPRKATFCHPR